MSAVTLSTGVAAPAALAFDTLGVIASGTAILLDGPTPDRVQNVSTFGLSSMLKAASALVSPTVATALEATDTGLTVNATIENVAERKNIVRDTKDKE